MSEFETVIKSVLTYNIVIEVRMYDETHYVVQRCDDGLHVCILEFDNYEDALRAYVTEIALITLTYDINRVSVDFERSDNF